MEKITERVDPNKIYLNPRWMYYCRNRNNVEKGIYYIENKKCSICDHRYDVPTRLNSQQSL